MDEFDKEGKKEEDFLKDDDDDDDDLDDTEDNKLDGHTSDESHDHSAHSTVEDSSDTHESHEEHKHHESHAGYGEEKSESTQSVEEHKDHYETQDDTPSNSDESIQINKDDIKKYASYVLIAAVVIVAYYFFLGAGANPEVTGNVINPPTQNPPSSNVIVQIDDTDPILGDKNAEINIIEFSDFQCPFCSRANDDALAQLKNSDFFKNGQVNLVYKHFPLNSIHPEAQKAAEASECANRQGKFWEYHDLLFADQQALDIASLKRYALQVGIDTNEFDGCLDGNEAASKVASDLQQATVAGGQGTPYFVIINKNGDTIPVSGAQPWPNFEVAINSLL